MIRSADSAAGLLRGLALQLDDPTTVALVARLEAVSDPSEAEHVGQEFRAWLARRHLLLTSIDVG